MSSLFICACNKSFVASANICKPDGLNNLKSVYKFTSHCGVQLVNCSLTGMLSQMYVITDELNASKLRALQVKNSTLKKNVLLPRKRLEFLSCFILHQSNNNTYCSLYRFPAISVVL